MTDVYFMPISLALRPLRIKQNIPPGKQIANRIVAAVLFEDSKHKKSISLALKAKKSTRKIKPN